MTAAKAKLTDNQTLVLCFLFQFWFFDDVHLLLEGQGDEHLRR